MTERYLSTDMLRRLGLMEFEVKDLVEGILAGVHRSPFRGFSVEFAQHRPYVPGDDIRHIDWKVYGRSERYQIKQYYEETNFVATVVLDASPSMEYGSCGRSKFEHGCFLAAGLAYIVVRQHDAVSFSLFDRETFSHVPPGHQFEFLHALTRAMKQTDRREATDLDSALSELAMRLERRGVVIVLSDLLDDPDAVRRGISRLRFQGHDVLLMHILDPDELDFPFEGNLRFQGLEDRTSLRVDSRRIAEAYRAEMDDHLSAIRSAAGSTGCDYFLCRTDQRPEGALLRYVAMRSRRLGGRG